MKSSPRDSSRVSVDIPKASHRRLKAIAALRGKSVKDLVIESIEYMSECSVSDHVPNEETRKTLLESKKGKNFNEYENPRDFFKKFGY